MPNVSHIYRGGLPNSRDSREIYQLSRIYMFWKCIKNSRVFTSSHVLELLRTFRNWAKLALLALCWLSNSKLWAIGLVSLADRNMWHISIFFNSIYWLSVGMHTNFFKTNYTNHKSTFIWLLSWVMSFQGSLTQSGRPIFLNLVSRLKTVTIINIQFWYAKYGKVVGRGCLSFLFSKLYLLKRRADT